MIFLENILDIDDEKKIEFQWVHRIGRVIKGGRGGGGGNPISRSTFRVIALLEVALEMSIRS